MGGINRDRMFVLISIGSRVRNFRRRNWSWHLLFHHRVGGATTTAAWVGLGAAFGKPYMETIMSRRVPRTLDKVWDTTSKPKTRGEATSQELPVKGGNRNNESLSTGGFLPHKDPSCFIE